LAEARKLTESIRKSPAKSQTSFYTPKKTRDSPLDISELSSSKNKYSTPSKIRETSFSPSKSLKKSPMN